jgi:hypothetical protein
MLKHYEYQSDFARKYYGEGRQEGLQEGRQKQIDLVRDLVVEKFGPIEPDIEARVASASDEELTEIAKRVLRATSIDAVFRRS